MLVKQTHRQGRVQNTRLLVFTLAQQCRSLGSKFLLKIKVDLCFCLKKYVLKSDEISKLNFGGKQI